MKSIWKALVVAAALLLVAGPVWADTLSVSADIPVSYSFSASGVSSSKASGVLVGVSLPFLVGLGYENYKVTGTDASNYTLTNKTSMYDVFVDLPIPIVSVRLGAGLGKGDVSSTNTGVSYDSATMHQVFANVGWEILPFLDVHLGIHNVTGNAKVTGTSTNVPLGGKMYTIGAKLGF